ncbi:hypothetical protein TKK_0008429 [Trichogramma kaykai]
MRWQPGGNFESVATICNYDWLDCPHALIDYVWSEVVTDVAECLATETFLWKILALLVVCVIIFHLIFWIVRWVKSIQAYKDQLGKVNQKVQDLELQLNVLTYKIQYGVWSFLNIDEKTSHQKNPKPTSLNRGDSIINKAMIEQSRKKLNGLGGCISELEAQKDFSQTNMSVINLSRDLIFDDNFQLFNSSSENSLSITNSIILSGKEHLDANYYLVQDSSHCSSSDNGDAKDVPDTLFLLGKVLENLQWKIRNYYVQYFQAKMLIESKNKTVLNNEIPPTSKNQYDASMLIDQKSHNYNQVSIDGDAKDEPKNNNNSSSHNQNLLNKPTQVEYISYSTEGDYSTTEDAASEEIHDEENSIKPPMQDMMENLNSTTEHYAEPFEDECTKTVAGEAVTFDNVTHNQLLFLQNTTNFENDFTTLIEKIQTENIDESQEMENTAESFFVDEENEIYFQPQVLDIIKEESNGISVIDKESSASIGFQQNNDFLSHDNDLIEKHIESAIQELSAIENDSKSNILSESLSDTSVNRLLDRLIESERNSENLIRIKSKESMESTINKFVQFQRLFAPLQFANDGLSAEDYKSKITDSIDTDKSNYSEVLHINEAQNDSGIGDNLYPTTIDNINNMNNENSQKISSISMNNSEIQNSSNTPIETNSENTESNVDSSLTKDIIFDSTPKIMLEPNFKCKTNHHSESTEKLDEYITENIETENHRTITNKDAGDFCDFESKDSSQSITACSNNLRFQKNVSDKSFTNDSYLSFPAGQRNTETSTSKILKSNFSPQKYLTKSTVKMTPNRENKTNSLKNVCTNDKSNIFKLEKSKSLIEGNSSNVKSLMEKKSISERFDHSCAYAFQLKSNKFSNCDTTSKITEDNSNASCLSSNFFNSLKEIEQEETLDVDKSESSKMLCISDQSSSKSFVVSSSRDSVKSDDNSTTSSDTKAKNFAESLEISRKSSKSCIPVLKNR